MTEVDNATYEEKRDHVRTLIKSHPNLTLTEVCEWIGKPKRTQLSYVSQVLSGKYGKGKRSPNVVNDIVSVLQKRGFWYEIGNIPEEFEIETESNSQN